MICVPRLGFCCKRQAEEALQAMRQIMARLKLTVNEEKTHLCRVPQEHYALLTGPRLK